MSSGRKTFLIAFLAAVVALILLTWGSVGSAILTLGLLLGGIAVALKKALNRDDDNYFLEE